MPVIVLLFQKNLYTHSLLYYHINLTKYFIDRLIMYSNFYIVYDLKATTVLPVFLIIHYCFNILTNGANWYFQLKYSRAYVHIPLKWFSCQQCWPSANVKLQSPTFFKPKREFRHIGQDLEVALSLCYSMFSTH